MKLVTVSVKKEYLVPVCQVTGISLERGLLVGSDIDSDPVEQFDVLDDSLDWLL